MFITLQRQNEGTDIKHEKIDVISDSKGCYEGQSMVRESECD